MTDQKDGAQPVPTKRLQQMRIFARPRRTGEKLPRLILAGGAVLLALLIAGIFIASLSPSSQETAGEEIGNTPTSVLAAAREEAPVAAVPPANLATPAPPVEPVASVPLTPPTGTRPQAEEPLRAPIAPPSAPPISFSRLVAQELAAARHAAVGTAQAGLQDIIDSNAYRLHTLFLPGYLSFMDRKLAELKAYNLFALDWVAGKLTGQKQDRSTASLMAAFEAPFLTQVVAPAQTRRELEAVGTATARHYANEVEGRLLLLKQSGIFPAEDWQSLPPLTFTDRNGRRIVTPVADISATSPVFLAALGGIIGSGMATRFERSYRTLDVTSLTLSSGESIFRIGRDAWIYYGTFIVYWIGLFLLLRSQLVPINLFGALFGWVLWEIFSWSSWLGYEWWQYEHTRNTLEPLIVAFAEDYFAQLAQIGADIQQTGAFRSLHQIEAAFAGQ